MIDSREIILSELSHITIMLSSGFTLQESLKSMHSKEVFVSRDLAQRWVDLRQEIREGLQGALVGVESLHRQLSLEKDFEDLFQKVSLLPRIQAMTALLLIAISFLCRIFFLGGSVNVMDYLALFLGGCGLFSFSVLMKLFYRDLWFFDWIRILTTLCDKIATGKTLQQSLQEMGSGRLLTKLPTGLRHLLTEVKVAECVDESSKANRAKTSRYFQRALADLQLILRAKEKSLPLVKLMTQLIEASVKSLKIEHEKRGIHLSFFFLLPLYLFFLPACLLIIVGPFLSSFAET